MFRFIVVLLLLVIFVLLFQTRSIKVKGNEYYGENSIISWLKKDKLSMNTVYLFWKYNYTDAEVPSVVEEMKLTFENPWTLVAHVKEKGKSGYVSFNDPKYNTTLCSLAYTSLSGVSEYFTRYFEASAIKVNALSSSTGIFFPISTFDASKESPST